MSENDDVGDDEDDEAELFVVDADGSYNGTSCIIITPDPEDDDDGAAVVILFC